MKKLTILIHCFLFIQLTISQNLVNNSGFEEYNTCPSSQGDLFAIGWNVTPNSGGSSPDYFNECAPFGSQVTVPDNVVGSQAAYDGQACVGFFVYGSDSLREYVQTKLASPLISGETYTVSFYVSFADKFGKAINSLGANFSVEALEGTGEIGVIELEPQFENDFVVTDKENWTFLSGSFVADGGEEYLTIGNFNNQDDTQFIDATDNPAFPTWGYYYLDYVSVSATLGIYDQVIQDNLSIYPNPANKFINLNLNNGKIITSITIYSSVGLLIKQIETNEVNTQINIGELQNGIYFLEIKDSNNHRFTKKVIKI